MGDSNPQNPAQKAATSKSVAAANDKRQFPRFKIEGTASVGKGGVLEGIFGPKKHPVINLSQGGAMIRLGKKLPVESRHDVRIEIPKYREVIEGTVEIRWCLESAKNAKDIYVGVMFVGLPAAELRKIASMYELFSSQEFKAMAAVRKDMSSIRLAKAPKIDNH